MPGYPIRTSSDPCSVDSSPRHIAASHVLHRLSMPRHPPCALTHLQTQKPTIKKSKIAQNKHTTPPGAAHLLRCSQPLSNYQTPHPTTKMERQHRPNQQARVLSQDPTVCRRLRCLHQGRRLLLCTRLAPLQRTTPSRPGSGLMPEPFSWCSLERR